MSRKMLLLISMVFVIIQADSSVSAQSKPQTKSTTAPKSTPAVKPAAAPEMSLARLASDESVFFFASNGWKKSDPKSKNKTEQFWALESVQEFVQQLGDEIKKTVKERTQTDAQASLTAKTIPVLLSAALEHPMAASLISFTTDVPSEINFAIVVDTESDSDQVREAFEKLVHMIPPADNEALTEETIEGAKFYCPPLPGPQAILKPRFAMFKSYLILTMGDATAADTIKKLNGTGKSPAWLDSTLRDLKVDRPSMVWHIDAEAIWKTVDPLIQDSRLHGALDASGLLALKRIASVSGLDAVASVDKMTIETTGQPKGLLALFPDKPLTASELKTIPANPSQATMVRFDLAQLVEMVLTIADQVDPMPRQQFDMISAQGEHELGFSIKDDLLKAFGDVWSTYISGTEAGGGFVPGVVVTASLKDQKKMTKVQDELVKRVNQIMQQMGPQAPISLVEFTSRGAKGYRVQINNLPVPVAPTWVITKDQFVLGVSPQLVSAHLSAASAKTSFADNADVAVSLKRDPKSVMISYRDPKPEIQGLYTMVNMFSPMVIGQLRQQGIDFNLPPLPPYSEIEPLLAPSVSTLTRNGNGWKSESHGVVPSMTTASPAVVAVAVALLLPAVQQAREAARRSQSQNNLKQIGLAMHNYHDTFGHFPERAGLDKGGNPGLSWRVKILPYIDQAPLYNQFHLDEPWDSDHNKTLISKMPGVYASNNDPELVTEHKTRYMVIDAEGALFDGDDGPRIAQITDGTSNTIMAVEATPESAVIWTAPDDLEVDFADPLLGLAGARVGGFFALLADGSVRFISQNIDVNVLKALITRAGGEVVGNF